VASPRVHPLVAANAPTLSPPLLIKAGTLSKSNSDAMFCPGGGFRRVGGHPPPEVPLSHRHHLGI